ncbi:MAG: hypothetical protein EXS48_03450 [Candidatus Staskawiczbacteria bacterium]|nr:hypothetical protein [Candidatus Staskawiczbacteria bacterium]
MNKSLLIKSIVIGFIGGIALYGIFAPQTINADLNNTSNGLSQSTLVQNGKLTFCRLNASSFGPSRTVEMAVTAYNSDRWQTDEDPLIAASGKHVFDGMIAINGLKFGTRVKIPKYFGDKVFIVEDRMHARKGIYHADVWMEEYQDAVDFGVKITDIKIEIPTT